MTQEVEIKVKGVPLDRATTDFDLFTVWKEYEAIAMHFNDLLLKIRTQSLAAVAAFGTAAGLLLRGENISHELRWGALTAVFSSPLCVFWVAIWIPDFAYWQSAVTPERLKHSSGLKGKAKKSNRTSGIYISTLIEQAVARRKPAEQAAAFDDSEYQAAILADPAKHEDLRLKWGRWTFLRACFALLVGLLSLS